MSDASPADPLPLGFRDVDATARAKILRCLDTLNAMPAGRAYKDRALELLGLGPGSAALDVACGLGDDVARLKGRCGRAVGVDRSTALIDEARARHEGSGCEFRVAEGDALPFDDATFDAVRIDRALQHIADPGAVVREMARVAKPGGVVLAVEPDWGTFLLGGPYSPLLARLERDWVGSFRNPRIGRELSALLADAGVVDRRWEGLWLPTHGFDETDLLFEVAATARSLAAEFPGAGAWLEEFRRGEAYGGVLLLICWGRKS